MELNAEQVYPSQIHQISAWHEMYLSISTRQQRLSTADTNSCDIDLSLPTYDEIHYNVERSIPVSFDQISLPSYEAAVNWPIPRAETSVPIPESSSHANSVPNQYPLQHNRCSFKKCMKCLVYGMLTLVSFVLVAGTILTVIFLILDI